jgi:hypothetical protein
MLKAIISQMARYENRLNDTERGLIDAAVNAVWNEKAREGTVDGIIAALHAAGHPQADDLATALLPFSEAGTYGPFFLGDTNLDLSADLTVFELSDLSSREELRSVVLTSIMFVASQTMRKLDRQIPKALIIDEAWAMLKGGAMADFVETYSRTCRKYGASLITATQSINDFYKSGGSKAALENSDWMLVLQQKPETIADFRKSDRFEMDNFTDALLRSLKRNGTEYSDLLIRGPDTQTVCRLVLDPFSGTLYSSSPPSMPGSRPRSRAAPPWPRRSNASPMGLIARPRERGHDAARIHNQLGCRHRLRLAPHGLVRRQCAGRCRRHGADPLCDRRLLAAHHHGAARQPGRPLCRGQRHPPRPVRPRGHHRLLRDPAAGRLLPPQRLCPGL